MSIRSLFPGDCIRRGLGIVNPHHSGVTLEQYKMYYRSKSEY
jgi:hypothetical protein